MQVEIASKNCKQNLQVRFEFNKENNEATMNQNAKVTFLLFFLTETNLWLSLRLVKRQFSSLYRWCPNMKTTRIGGTNCQTMKRNPITKCDLRFLIFTGNSKPQCCIISKSCRSKRNKLLANWHVHSGT